jgi:hypothetical protein
MADNKAVELEQCGDCWSALTQQLRKPLQAGRKRPSRKRKAA